MSIRFILGRAGSGKTHLCVREVVRELARAPEGPPLILLVPDQATYQMERRLLEGGVSGFFRACPYSFRRLAHRVLGETGGSPLPVLDEVGKRMFLAAIVRDLRKDLRVYGDSSRRVGLMDSLAACIAEFRRYGKTPEDVGKEAERQRDALGHDTPLALKLADLARIYEAFERKIEGRFLDGEATLTLLARKLGDSRWIEGARVWVDGFSGFTPQEHEVLKALIARTGEVSVALCLDPRSLPRTLEDLDALSPFHPTEETYLRIRDALPAADKRFLVVGLPEDRASSPRFRGRPSLERLETDLFARALRPLSGSPREIRLVEAPDRRAEVRAVAQDILRRVRGEGVRYRDLALILREIEPYADLLRSAFAEYGIPFFLDEPRSVAHHPVVELVRSAVRSVATGWPADAVLQYLKTDLVRCGEAGEEGLRRDRLVIDEIENYARAFGVRGTEWTTEEPWDRRALEREDSERIPAEETEALERVDSARRLALKELAAFDMSVSAGGRRVCDITSALHRLLLDLDVRETLRAWTEEAERHGHAAAAEEHATVWKSVVALLGSLVESLGDEVLPLREYLDILEAGLSSLRLGLIPPTLDQVTIGSIERSRHPDLRAAFVLGVGDGAFPRPRAEDPLLPDGDRERLRAGGFELAPSTREELHRERYFAYIAFTRASEALWVSYPRADEEGKELLPSAFVRGLRALFPNLSTEVLERDDVPASVEEVFRPADLAVAVVSGARAAGDDVRNAWWAGSYDRWVGDEGLRAVLERVLPSLAYDNRTRLGAPAARGLYGEEPTSGVVALEHFSQCPFQFLAKHGLGLRTRPAFELTPPDLGSLYHAVMKGFFDRTRARSLRWADLDSETGIAILDEALEGAVRGLKAEILEASARNRALKDEARQTLREYLDVLLFQARRTRFEPAAAEVSFGKVFEIDLGRGRQLGVRGRIDRVDAVRDAGSLRFRVIDYKLSDKKLDLWRVEEGLALQLTTYLLAVASDPKTILGVEEARAAGAFFAPILRPVEEVDVPPEEGELQKAQSESLKLRGVFREDAAEALDHGVQPGEKSPVHAFSRNKDGGLGWAGRSDALPEDVFAVALDRTRHHLRRIGRAILEGEIGIEPCRIRTWSACSNCEYASVCRFEPSQNRYRTMTSRPRQVVITEWKALTHA